MNLKKQLILIASLLLIFTSSCARFTLSPSPFTSIWRTNSANEVVTIPTQGGFSYNARIDWGDGSPISSVNSHDDANLSHSYAVPGTYTILITGFFEAFGADGATLAYKTQIREVVDFGRVGLRSLDYAFADVSNLVRLTDQGFLFGIETMNYTFSNTSNFDSSAMANWRFRDLNSIEGVFQGTQIVSPPIDDWDTGSVTNMRRAFADTTLALPDLANWDMSSVTNAEQMFSASTTANPNVRNWDVSNIQNMSGMFRATSVAQPDTELWDTSSTTNMLSMFQFSQLANPNTTNWDVSNVTRFTRMFQFAQSANPDTSNWVTDSALSITGMFMQNPVANPEVSGWNTSSVTEMNLVFQNAISANPNVTSWNTSNVTTMREMFNGASSATPNVSNWETSNVTQMSLLFNGINAAAVINMSTWDFEAISEPDQWMHSSSSPTPTSNLNYSNFLVNLDGQNINVNVIGDLRFQGVNYQPFAAAARTNLVAKGWTILDAGPE